MYHVLCSESSPIVYQMDGQTMLDYIYLKHGVTYILIWESSMNEKDIPDQRLTHWYEKNAPFFIMGAIALFFLLYLFANVQMSMLAEKCESCEEYDDEHMYGMNLKVRLRK